MLEPDALKGARPVLRGGGGGDPTSLPDYGKADGNSNLAGRMVRDQDGASLVPRIPARRESRGVMSDLRQYRFRDWLALFLKAVPAFLLAILILLLPLVLYGVMVLMARLFR